MVINLTEIIANKEIYSNHIFDRFLEILLAPYQHPEMLWIGIPLLITIFMMEFYFARYRGEELGWNTAYGNAIVLIFVSVDLIRHTYIVGELFYFNIKTFALFLLIVDGLILTLINFYHLLPKNFAFGLSSKLPINFLAYCAIIFIYTEIPADMFTLGGLFLFLLLLYIIMKFIDLIEFY